MSRIQTTATLTSIGDISRDWKIAAVRDEGGWQWCGDLFYAGKEIRDSMHLSAGAEPRISCVTGRDEHGRETLYARLYPEELRVRR